ncbi:hypothetical protein BKA67DRAFT_588849 [Truncatella angustata]|uniref:ABM domain-containing protein n=1 Tax=Truncatella angustata TaxID=152316 RepID=A0A9P8UAJ3_9PEZI|nr:uncharacterized protein BKA67DRAFT_588849 [Truncatella angustata]KAH6638558.1 hypothetical protein BKA67DRAFT_588849 [Truncatella angustata]KAH8199783.1 hypothetical protein TruAng_006064 [Truncatella angustata]
MSAVTEIASLHLKAGVDPDVAAKKVSSVVLEQPGSLCVRHSTRHENSEYIALFIDWEALSAHEKFMQTPAYGPFNEDIGGVIQGVPSIYHVPFVPFPPTVLSNDGGRGKTAVAEVIHAYFPADLDLEQQQEVLAQAQEFLDESKKINPKGFSGEVAHGFALEDIEFDGAKSRVLVLVLGWDSVDAHLAYRETDDFARTIPLLRTLPRRKGIEVWHVANKVATK